jgi:hypothetical protein
LVLQVEQDGHTLKETMLLLSGLKKQRPKTVIVDKVSQGLDLEHMQI